MDRMKEILLLARLVWWRQSGRHVAAVRVQGTRDGGVSVFAYVWSAEKESFFILPVSTAVTQAEAVTQALLALHKEDLSQISAFPDAPTWDPEEVGP